MPTEPTLSPGAMRQLQDGLAMQRAGRLADAQRHFEEALCDAPGHPDALYFCAMLHVEAGRLEQGISLLEASLRARPGFLAAQFNLGMAWRAAGREGDAAAAFGRVVSLDPEMADAHAALADSLIRSGQPEQAIASYRRAVALRPGDAGLLVRLGVALQQNGAAGEAIPCFRRALAIEPRSADAHNDLGVALSILNRTAAAADSFRQAIAADPAHVAAHVNLGLALLRLGQWREGWAEFDWRLCGQGNGTVPRWDGLPMPGGVLLLQAEQGFGDTLQFCRYVPMAAERAGVPVVLEVPAPLVRLLAGLDCATAVVPTGADRAGFGRRCALGSLPRIFETTPETIPAIVPYLHADPGAVAAWRRRLADRHGLKVGIVWAGNPYLGAAARDTIDQRRSLALSNLAPLAEVPRVTLVSLQRGPAAVQARTPPRGMGLFDPTDALEDFADTAALVTALDLVISVDTSVAHLAGALGVPGWALVRFDADWRWPWSGDSPWYPTLRQFRQRAPGDWAPVITVVRDGLARMTAGPRD